MGQLDSGSGELVSIILPAFNAARFLPAAVESILGQSYQNIELIVVDDGSVDTTLEVLKNYRDDERVKIISRENRGITRSLNEAVAASSGEYIARMDADDIAAPERLADQLSYMKKEGLHVCGSNVELFGEAVGKKSHQNYPEKNDAIRASFLAWGKPFCHPAVMFHKSVFDRYCYREYKSIEDYRLWAELCFDPQLRFGNLQRPLLSYRLHPSQETKSPKERGWRALEEVAIVGDVLSGLEPSIREDEVWAFSELLRTKKHFISAKNRRKAMDYVEKLLSSKLLDKDCKQSFKRTVIARIQSRSRPFNKLGVAGAIVNMKVI
ncbi:glycosyltransferase family 2 protein [Spongiibacter tropicus]|uniref:glycosyltransferase family 2 protein n=1 Tax=Spongiibacter tropicus TaxID=454602 RepID=UPI0035BE8A17